MSDTPTFASLLTQWTAGGPAARADVYAHLRGDAAAAESLQALVRDELNSALPANRLIAAEALVEVYRDEPSAAAALGRVLRRGDPSAATDTVPVLRKLSPERAGPLWVEFAVHAPTAFGSLPAGTHRAAGSAAARAGHADWWLALFGHAAPETESALVMGLADAARHAPHDLSAAEPVLRPRSTRC